jgi:hypothetical protein
MALNVEFNSQYIPGKGLDDRVKQTVLLPPLFRQKIGEHKILVLVLIAHVLSRKKMIRLCMI